MEEILDNIPKLTDKWTDFSESDPAYILLQVIASVFDRLNFYMDRQIAETLIGTVTRKANARKILELVSYKFGMAKSSTGFVNVYTDTVKLMGSVVRPYKIKKYDKFTASNSKLKFYASEDTDVVFNCGVRFVKPESLNYVTGSDSVSYNGVNYKYFDGLDDLYGYCSAVINKGEFYHTDLKGFDSLFTLDNTSNMPEGDNVFEVVPDNEDYCKKVMGTSYNRAIVVVNKNRESYYDNQGQPQSNITFTIKSTLKEGNGFLASYDVPVMEGDYYSINYKYKDMVGNSFVLNYLNVYDKSVQVTLYQDPTKVYGIQLSRVDDLYFSDRNEESKYLDFEVMEDYNDLLKIKFRDGFDSHTGGLLLGDTSFFEVKFLVSNGSTGLLSANSIDNFNGVLYDYYDETGSVVSPRKWNPVKLNCFYNNGSSISGGVDAEDVVMSKVNAPMYVKTLDVAVTSDDYKNIIQNVVGVDKAFILTPKSRNSINQALQEIELGRFKLVNTSSSIYSSLNSYLSILPLDVKVAIVKSGGNVLDPESNKKVDIDLIESISGVDGIIVNKKIDGIDFSLIDPMVLEYNIKLNVFPKRNSSIAVDLVALELFAYNFLIGKSDFSTNTNLLDLRDYLMLQFSSVQVITVDLIDSSGNVLEYDCSEIVVPYGVYPKGTIKIDYKSR